MRKYQLISIFLVLVLIAPITSSFVQIDSLVDLELVENAEEKNTKEKSESEKKEGLDEDEKFSSLNRPTSAILDYRISELLDITEGIKDIHSEVFTPPPELI